MKTPTVQQVIDAMSIRHDNESKVPRQYVAEAINRITQGIERNYERYPNSDPSLRGVAAIALRLYRESQTRVASISTPSIVA